MAASRYECYLLVLRNILHSKEKFVFPRGQVNILYLNYCRNLLSLLETTVNMIHLLFRNNIQNLHIMSSISVIVYYHIMLSYRLRFF
jgi:hypothetical protein